MTNKAILTGLLAGIAAGLCVLATVNMGPVAYFLMFIAAGAVGVATMGWGRDAGIAATVAAFGVLVLASGLPIAAASTLLLFVPAGWTGYLANLGHRRPGEAAVDWYPLGRILLHLMALLAFAFIAVGAAFVFRGPLG